jgi:hypothetical protein
VEDPSPAENGQCQGYLSSSKPWVPKAHNKEQWMQFDFGCVATVCGVAFASNPEVGGVCISAIKVKIMKNETKKWTSPHEDEDKHDADEDNEDEDKCFQVLQAGNVVFESHMLARSIQVKGIAPISHELIGCTINLVHTSSTFLSP